jgi:hypothetical protein
LIILVSAGCAPFTSTIVQLEQNKYLSGLKPEGYGELRGKKILLHGITDESKNTSNFSYYNPERTVGYQLLSENQMPQPLVSFFWYALEKGFEKAGVIIEDTAPDYDAELFITFRSLTDKEINFLIELRKRPNMIYAKSYVVKTSDGNIPDQNFLQKRAYSMIDSIVTAILDDPEVRKILLGS